MNEDRTLFGLVRASNKVKATIDASNRQMMAMGYTEHGIRHASIVAQRAKYILLDLGYTEHMTDMAAISGFLHDTGNAVSRYNHSISSAFMSMEFLKDINMQFEDILLIAGAIGNHEEPYGVPHDVLSSALIIADKSDVHRTRVQNNNFNNFDIHDRVNYSATNSDLIVSKEKKSITLIIETDEKTASVMEYFEIFLERMQLCRSASLTLDLTFKLKINGVELL